MNDRQAFEWGLRVGKRDAKFGRNYWGNVVANDYLKSNPFRNWAPCSQPYEGWKLAVHKYWKNVGERDSKLACAQLPRRDGAD